MIFGHPKPCLGGGSPQRSVLVSCAAQSVAVNGPGVEWEAGGVGVLGGGGQRRRGRVGTPAA